MTRSHALSLVVLALLLSGCRNKYGTYPKEIVFSAETGKWTLECTDSLAEPPSYIPIVTVVDDLKLQGLLLPHDLSGYAAVVSTGPPTSEHEWVDLLMPLAVDRDRDGWQLRMVKRRLAAPIVIDAGKTPLPARVVVEPQGSEGRFYDLLPSEQVRID